MAVRLSNSKDCRNAYREVLQGYTYVDEESFYIKHFKEADLGFIESVFKKCAEQAKDKGLLSQKDKLKFLEKEDYWSEEEEEAYLTSSLAVKDGYEHSQKIIDPQQRKKFEENDLAAQEKILKGLQ